MLHIVTIVVGEIIHTCVCNLKPKNNQIFVLYKKEM